MNEDNKPKEPVNQEPSNKPASPMDHVDLNSTVPAQHTDGASGAAKVVAVTIAVILVLIAGLMMALRSTDSDDGSNSNSSENSSETGEAASNDFAEWTPPQSLDANFEKEGEAILTLKEGGVTDDNTEEFANFDVVGSPENTFVMRRFNSTKDLPRLEGELSLDEMIDVVSKVDSEITEKQSINPLGSDARSIANSLNHDIEQLSLRFTTVDAENNVMINYWIIHVDYSEDVTQVYALSSPDLEDEAFTSMGALSNNLAYLYH